MQKFSKDYKLI